jgi:pilus assembly protein TadC
MSWPAIDELKDALAKISLGYDKKSALKEMAKNTGVEQVYSFVNAVNMSLESGMGNVWYFKQNVLHIT